VVILLKVRKLFCVGDSCRRKIFTEPLPGTVPCYARHSCRSSEALHWPTLALGARAYSPNEQMKAPADGGTRQSDIARQLDLSLRTV